LEKWAIRIIWVAIRNTGRPLVARDHRRQAIEELPDNVVRTVTENSRTLKFTNQGFEKE